MPNPTATAQGGVPLHRLRRPRLHPFPIPSSGGCSVLPIPAPVPGAIGSSKNSFPHATRPPGSWSSDSNPQPPTLSPTPAFLPPATC